ncbi:MAG: DNA repair protein RecN [Streptobacillus sp.]
MLKGLRIENLAIIDELDINLNKGLTVLTGETGAGKSIILDAISMIIGEKSRKEMIGKNSDNVYIEAEFLLNKNQVSKLDEIGYELDEELIISRDFDYDSNKVRVNGRRFNLSGLKDISSNILDIVGQHEHQYLLNSNNHIDLLDKFLDTSSFELKKELKKIIQEINVVNKEIEDIEKDKIDVLSKKELYNLIIKEIDNLKLKEDEEIELEQEYKLLFNSGIISEKLKYIVSTLSSYELKGVRRELEKISEYGEEFNELYSRFDNIYEEYIDILSELEHKFNNIQNDDTKLDKVSLKLEKIRKIKVKYGKSIPELLIYSKELKDKLKLIDFSSEILNEKIKHRDKLLYTYEEYSSKLSNMRKDKANYLKKLVSDELIELNMKNVIFDIEFKENEKLNLNGKDIVRFLISTNKGESLKDLSKIASGGEISRIMLALKIVFSKVDNISCLIFDEIDTGISGETVIKIAEKLKQLSKNVQIICVTHSPQIAAKADNHYYIYKEVKNDRTNTKIKYLNSDERVNEIARILSGDNITEASKIIVREMMK